MAKDDSECWWLWTRVVVVVVARMMQVGGQWLAERNGLRLEWTQKTQGKDFLERENFFIERDVMGNDDLPSSKFMH